MCGADVVNLSDACQAMGRLYHTNCFLCSVCGMLISHSTQTAEFHALMFYLFNRYNLAEFSSLSSV